MVNQQGLHKQDAVVKVMILHLIQKNVKVVMLVVVIVHVNIGLVQMMEVVHQINIVIGIREVHEHVKQN